MMTEGYRTNIDKREEEDGKTWNCGQADTGQERQRLVYLDVLRFLATIFVIAAHTVSLGAAMAPAQSARWYAYEICAYFFLCCNPLFVMISGALLLSVQGEPLWHFYKKRLIRVLFPMLVYYVMYVCAKEGIRWVFPDHWPKMAVRILRGAPREAPHFWLIYVILGLYILTPLLRLLLRRIPKRLYGWATVRGLFQEQLITHIEQERG